MPEVKVGDKVLVEGTVEEIHPDVPDGYPILVRRGRGHAAWYKPDALSAYTDPLPPGGLGYSEEGHEIRRGRDIPEGWERRQSPRSRWRITCRDVAYPDHLYECRPPERQQTVEEAATALIEWCDQASESDEIDSLVSNLRAALEREGRA